MISTLDWATALLAFASCFFIGLRANLLKPKIRAFVDAPPWIWGAMVALSIACGAAGVNVLLHGHASPREFVTFAVLTLTSGALLLNVLLTGRKAPLWAQSSPSSPRGSAQS